MRSSGIIAAFLLVGCLCFVASADDIVPDGKQCDCHEEFQECGTACPPTCQVPEPRFCTLQCVAGCFCKKNFIRAYANGPCIREKDCPTF